MSTRVLKEEGWQDLAAKGFDAPRPFAAFLHTLRWNCVTATDPNLFQALYERHLPKGADAVRRPRYWIASSATSVPGSVAT